MLDCERKRELHGILPKVCVLRGKNDQDARYIGQTTRRDQSAKTESVGRLGEVRMQARGNQGIGKAAESAGAIASKKEKRVKLAAPARTGWPAGLMQDDSRELSKWFAGRLGARHQVDMVCVEIIRRTEESWGLN